MKTTKQKVWVYVLENTQTRNFTIGISADMSLLIQRMASGTRLAYRREFGNMLEAFAHKLLLERVSIDSLKYMLRADEWNCL